jgi:DNA-binding NtrC family response regulator
LLKSADVPWEEIASPDQFDHCRDELPARCRQGILYLREVNALSHEQQFALLSMMGELEEAGVRLLSSTTVSLSDGILRGTFDARLFALLAGAIIRVPSLREREEDIADLAQAMLERMGSEGVARRFSSGALNKLRSCQWPGNLVQLQAVVSSCAQLASGVEISAADIVNALAEFDEPLPAQDERLALDRDLRAAREDFERVYFEYHLSREKGNMSRVANRAGLERTHLYRKIKQLGIKSPRRPDE